MADTLVHDVSFVDNFDPAEGLHIFVGASLSGLHAVHACMHACTQNRANNAPRDAASGRQTDRRTDGTGGQRDRQKKERTMSRGDS